MKRRFAILLALCGLLSLAGCSDYSDVKINSCRVGAIDGFSLMSGQMGTSVRLFVDVDNPPPREIKVKDMTLLLYEADGDLFAEVTSRDEILVPASYEGEISAAMDIELKSFHPLSFMLGAKDFDNMTFDVDMRVRYGILTHRVRRDGIPVRSLINRLGSSKK